MHTMQTIEFRCRHAHRKYQINSRSVVKWSKGGYSENIKIPFTSFLTFNTNQWLFSRPQHWKRFINMERRTEVFNEVCYNALWKITHFENSFQSAFNLGPIRKSTHFEKKYFFSNCVNMGHINALWKKIEFCMAGSFFCLKFKCNY